MSTGLAPDTAHAAAEDTAGPHYERRRFRPISLLSIVAILVAWELAALLAGTNRATGATVVPSIQDVFGSLRSFANYWKGGLGAADTRSGAPPTYWGAVLAIAYNTYVTVLRLAAGLALGLFSGVALAVLVSWSRTARETLSFLAHFARMMPLLAMIPLFAVWFGNNQTGAIIFVAFAVFVVMFAITMNAIGNVPPYYAQYARSLGASGPRTYATVILPSILPQLKAGSLLALGFSWSAVIAAEFLGQQYGLGRIVTFAEFYGKLDVIALTGVVTVVVSAVSYIAARRLLNWMTRWME